ncbi:hypothetical protein KNH48_11305 [Heyndrickxia coagulans]|nr:hypothetical protein KNH48_11305 [Heyndrickxia coagulans]
MAAGDGVLAGASQSVQSLDWLYFLSFSGKGFFIEKNIDYRGKNIKSANLI